MKRLALFALAAFASSLAVVAAPALSLTPYTPDPVAFSTAVPAGGGATVDAPKRFNMVGLTWRGGGEPRISVRTRRDGGEWTAWAELDTHSEDAPDPGQEGHTGGGVSAPAWVGSADQIQYRSSRRLRGGRLRFLNTRGDATAASRLRNGLRHVANSAVLALAGAAGPPVAHAADGRPAMVTRAGWGADKCKPKSGPVIGDVKAALVHHTVSLNNYTRAEAPQIVLGICLFHTGPDRKWNDIGYNFLVDRFGTIYEGRAGGVDRAVVGAQAEGFNSHTTGIANIGDFMNVQQTPEALAAMARLIRWKLPLSGTPTSGNVALTRIGGSGATVTVPRVSAHRDVNSTDCPGDLLYDQLPELRRLVGSLTAAGTPTALRARTTARGGIVVYGKKARISGTLTAAGVALVRKNVAVEAQIGGRWRKVATARTDSKGRFTTLIKPQRSRPLRVRFGGAGTLRPAVSAVFVVGLRPILKFTTAPRDTALGARTTITGTVAPRLSPIFRVLQVRRGRTWKTIGVRPAAVDRRGRVRNSFKPPTAGAYRYYLEARASAANALARSRKAPLRVTGGRGGGAGAP